VRGDRPIDVWPGRRPFDAAGLAVPADSDRGFHHALGGDDVSAPEGLLCDYACPNCGYDGPHHLFAPNEAECGDCYAEFSVNPGDYDRPEIDDA
jgi:hypothetical protein